MIKRCEVCGNMIRTVYKLPYEDIVGMIHGRYVQHIGICDTCGLIITQNPFSEEALANRYSNFSKFEYDTQNYFLNETSEYANRSNHQIHFIYENVQDIGSVIEVGANCNRRDHRNLHVSIVSTHARMLDLEELEQVFQAD